MCSLVGVRLELKRDARDYFRRIKRLVRVVSESWGDDCRSSRVVE